MIKMAELYRAGGIEVARLQANEDACFPRHTHAEYVISANVSGCEHIWLDGKEFTALGRTVSAYNPNAVQSSSFDQRAGCAEFISLYIEPNALSDVARENGWLSSATAPELAQGVFNCDELYELILDFYRAIQQTNNVAADAAFVELSATLLESSGHRIDSPNQSHDTRALSAALEYMRDHLDVPVSLDHLAAINVVSKYQFIRSFKAAVGMPPAAYHMQLRLTEARRRLRIGHDVQDVAFALGFYDQSHFINAFRKIMGISPLRFAAPGRQFTSRRQE